LFGTLIEFGVGIRGIRVRSETCPDFSDSKIPLSCLSSRQWLSNIPSHWEFPSVVGKASFEYIGKPATFSSHPLRVSIRRKLFWTTFKLWGECSNYWRKMLRFRLHGSTLSHSRGFLQLSQSPRTSVALRTRVGPVRTSDSEALFDRIVRRDDNRELSWIDQSRRTDNRSPSGDGGPFSTRTPFARAFLSAVVPLSAPPPRMTGN
jgi:hypothetical protein